MIFQVCNRNRRTRTKCYSKNALVRAACPQENCVNWICGRLRTNISERNGDILWTGGFLDFVEDSERHLLRRYNARPAGRPKPQLELPASNPREYFSSQ